MYKNQKHNNQPSIQTFRSLSTVLLQICLLNTSMQFSTGVYLSRILFTSVRCVSL